MKILIYSMLAILLIACTKEGADLLSDVGDNTYALETNRGWNRDSNISFPSDELKESDYETELPLITGYVEFSNNQQNIKIIPSEQSTSNEAIFGILVKKENNSRSYDLTEGTFAGGRFVIWKENEHYEFEQTIYGSGVPIIYSVRGILKIIYID